MTLQQLLSRAKNIPRIPVWTDVDVEKTFLEFATNAKTVSEIYDALEILHKHRILIFGRFARYIARKYANSPNRQMQHLRFLCDAKQRAISSLD